MSDYSLLRIARYSLAFLWLFTAISSVFLAPEIGYGILKSAGIVGLLADLLVIGASLLDVALGIWVLSARSHRYCCICQIGLIIIFTILLTLIDASFWIHPFGPLTKNLPIIALILMIYLRDPKIQGGDDH